jgi:hypothetical protein
MSAMKKLTANKGQMREGRDVIDTLDVMLQIALANCQTGPADCAGANLKLTCVKCDGSPALAVRSSRCHV